MYSNEYTAYGGEGAPEEAFMCHSRMLTVMQVRRGVRRDRAPAPPAYHSDSV